MPTISIFYGIKITMNYNDHNPPHFHAEYQDYEVTVDILSNSGQITITHDTNGAVLSDGLGNTIPYTEILTASNDVANLDAPALGTLTSTQPTLTGSLTNESATWTYTYDNTFAYNSGIYGGAGINGGRVTYTASSP